MKKILLLFPVFVLLFLSCGKDEDPMQREQKEMDKAMSGPVSDTYKAFKVALRGTATAGKDSLFDQARLNLLAATGYVLVQSAQPDSTRSLNDVIQLAKSAETIAETVPMLIKTDEDTLPTVLENIAWVMDPKNSGATWSVASLLNEDEEHLILAGAWIVSQRAPAGLCLYELSRVDDDSLRTPDLKLISKFARSILYYLNNWPYHGEQSADELVQLTEKEKDYLLKNPWPAVDAQGNAVTPEQAWHQLHGIAYLLRGLNREKMEDRKADALADMETFVSEAEAGGLDNEVTWSAGAYVAISKEDKDGALKYLDKLAASKILSKDELAAINSTRDYISKRDNKTAMTTFNDKIAIVKITATYVGKLLSQSKPIKDLNGSKSGKEFLRLTTISPGNMLEGKSLNSDSLIEKSKSLLDKIGL